MSRIRISESSLRTIISEAVRQTLNEAFGHWQSQKLANLVKQHGMPKGVENYYITQLRDDNVADDVVASKPNNRDRYIQMGDGTFLQVNDKDNGIAQLYNQVGGDDYIEQILPHVRPNDEFAYLKSHGYDTKDLFSRKNYVPPTTRARDARMLRTNPYFKDGKDKEFSQEGEWNRKEADIAMNNLRNGYDRYGYPNKKL